MRVCTPDHSGQEDEGRGEKDQPHLIITLFSITFLFLVVAMFLKTTL